MVAAAVKVSDISLLIYWLHTLVSHCMAISHAPILLIRQIALNGIYAHGDLSVESEGFVTAAQD